MNPAAFAYRRAAAVDEALRMLGGSEGDARLLADVSRIDELAAIDDAGAECRLHLRQRQ